MCTSPMYIKLASPTTFRTGTITRTKNGRVSVGKSEVYDYRPSLVARPYRDGTYTMHFVDGRKVKNEVFANIDDAKVWMEGASYQPFRLLDGSMYMAVDCGKCEECLRKRKRRIQMLVKYDIKNTPYCDNFMLTLSYDEKHLHKDTDRARAFIDETGFHKVSRCSVAAIKRRSTPNLDTDFDSVSAIETMSCDNNIACSSAIRVGAGNQNYQHCDYGFLEYSDFSKFMKRLRVTLDRWYDIKAVKFVMCGEYGSDRTYIADNGTERKAKFRPHYHCSVWFSRTDKCNGYRKQDYNCKKHRGKRSLFDQYLCMNGGRVPALTEGMMRSIVQYLWNDLGSSSKKYGVKVERARNREACGAYVCKYISKQLQSNKHTNCYANTVVPMFVRTSIRLADKWIEILSHSLAEDVYSFRDDYVKDGRRVSHETFFPFYLLKRVASKRNSNPYEVLSHLVKRIEEIENSMTENEKLERSKHIKIQTLADISATSKHDE